MYGYGATVNGVFDAQTEEIVAAFQRHFRPSRVDGVADGSTILTLRNLIAALEPPAIV
jgi:N-acetylmuramoyl-L-alanine amidase